MADGNFFMKNLISIPAFGRSPNLGTLYSHYDQSFFSDKHISWEPDTIESATQVKCLSHKRCMLINDEKVREKVESIIGLDGNTKMSFLAGLLENCEGAASNYMNNMPNQAWTSCTIICQAKSWEEKLDLKSLLNYQVPHVVGVEANQQSHATHVVSGVFYGAEAYCILTDEDDAEETDTETKKNAAENLSKLASKWVEGFCQSENLANFKKRFNQEDQQLISHVTCQLYTDLHPQTLIKSGFFDVYKQTVELVQKILTVPNEVGQKKAVPVALQLCPLEILVNPNQKVTKKLTFEGSSLLATRCSKIFVVLKRVVASALKMRSANKGSFLCDSICEFGRLVLDYIELFKTELKTALEKDRRCAINSFLATRYTLQPLEDDTIFSSTLLSKWLKCKRSELVFMDWMSKAIGNDITFLAERDRLEELLPEFKKKKCVTVLLVPPLDELTNSFLASMKEHSSSRFQECYEHGLEEDPWHLNPLKNNLVKDKIRQLTRHVERNEETTSQVSSFFVTFAESSQPFRCSYLIYQSGRLLKGNFTRLPIPPTALRVSHPPAVRTPKRAKTTSSALQVEWDYEALGYPCQFIVEYRVKGSFDSWIQRRTTKPGQTKLSIAVKTGSVLEIRVAADTCVGCSEFCDVLDTSSPLEEDDQVTFLFPSALQVKSVTHNSAKFEWSTQPEHDSNLWVRVDCREKGLVSSSDSFREFKYDRNPCLLENLLPNTTYVLNIFDMKGEDLKCGPVEFTTRKVNRFASKLKLKQLAKIGTEDGISFYSVPIIQLNGRFTNAERFVFGEPIVTGTKNMLGPRKHRTILLVGTSDSGKTQLINAMINYIFNVEWQDPFRFQLVETVENVDNEKNIKIYDVRHQDGFRIHHSLTIIDTPSYDGSDPERNKKITERVREFFNDKNAIPEIDMVGFVMDSSEPELSSLQLYIYCSIISIFGVEMREDVNLFFNYADEEEPPLLEAIDEARLVTDGKSFRYHKFNTQAVFCRSDDPKDFSWSFDNFQKLFSSLAGVTKTVMSVNRQLRVMKRQLIAVVSGLIERMNTGIIEFRLLRETMEKIKCENENEFEFEELAVKNVFLPLGRYVTNCENCRMTCHVECGNEDDNFNCDVMNHSVPEETRTCRVCPGKCLWNVHRKDSFKLEYETQTQTTSSRAIKENYQAKLKKKLSLSKMIKELKSDIEKKKKELVELVQFVLRSLRKLKQMAKHLNSKLSISIFITSNTVCSILTQLIEAENEDRSSGFTKRKKILGTFRRICGRNGKNRFFPTEEFCSILDRDDNLLAFNVSANEDI